MDFTEHIRRALEEDIGFEDVTTCCVVPPNAKGTGQIIAKQNGIIAGLDVAQQVFAQLDPQVEFKTKVSEGQKVEKGQILAELSGHVRAMLTGERTALNFIGRMSGIATLSRQFVDAIAGTKAILLDTRKTAPGLRDLDKRAVQLGGGQNHRHGLHDMILIKDNHIDFAGSLVEAVRRAQSANTGIEIEVEARTLEDVQNALQLGVHRILLDNMNLETLYEAVKLNHGDAKLEASGNITLDNVRQVAETGVDYISVGALTHSPKVFDVSLDLATLPS